MTEAMATGIAADALERERQYVHHLYGRLDALREHKREQLRKVRATGAQGSRQNQSERDAFATLYEDRLAQLDAVESRLVFGRLDLHDADDSPRYIGRIGLTEDDQARLLVDWRAPEAASFYQATAFDPLGVRRRRHLTLKGRDVVSIEDDVLDPELADALGTAAGSGDGALLAALNARRTGRMGDIVATIQAEQDTIIRAALPGVLVVQGGPGTGKTAVALHRAAYLLYEQRERLARTGVLVVGPSDAFLRYIERVLPSLGETGVVLSSLGRLWPGLDAQPESRRRTAKVKGSLRMLDVVRRAVAQRQRVIAAPRRLDVDGTVVTLTPAQVKRARERARAGRKPHNEARATFVKILVRELADQLQSILEENGGAGNDADRAYLVEDVRSSHDVRVALNLCWMPMTPERLLAGVFSDPRILETVTPGFSERDRQALQRPADAAWTESDVPLLDEAAELLGVFDASGGRSAAAQEAQRQRDIENAEAALRNVDAQLREEGIDGMIDAAELAGMNQEFFERGSLAERAEHDRSWTFGHVVVDEAQELTAMQWHLLERRCPLRSFTVVGDIAQADAPGAPRSWAQAMAPMVQDRFRLAELSVNYRTPREVIELADRVAEEAGLPVTRAEAVRDAVVPPYLASLPEESQLSDAVVEQIARAETLVPDGLVAVIAPQERLAALRQAVGRSVGERLGRGAGDAEAGHDVLVIGAREAKGLEFDAVIVADPGGIVAESDGGVGNLYVALTRTTQWLAVLSLGDRAPAALLPTV